MAVKYREGAFYFQKIVISKFLGSKSMFSLMSVHEKEEDGTILLYKQLGNRCKLFNLLFLLYKLLGGGELSQNFIFKRENRCGKSIDHSINRVWKTRMLGMFKLTHCCFNDISLKLKSNSYCYQVQYYCLLHIIGFLIV